MQRITDRTAGAIRHFYKSVIDTYLKMGAQFTFLLYEIVSAVIKCTYKTKQLHHMEPKSLRKNVRTELERFPVCSGRTLGSLQRRCCTFNTEYSYTLHTVRHCVYFKF